MRETYIDALKGWGIIGIIFVHCQVSIGPFTEGLSQVGAHCVQLFFVISAFLLFDSYNKFFLKTTECSHVSRYFVWVAKRIIRLLPLYWLSIFVHLATHSWSPYWLGKQGCVNFSNIFSHLIFANGFSPYYINSILGVEWYVTDLVIFVLIIPFIYRFIKSLYSATIGLIGSMAALLAVNQLFTPLPLQSALTDFYIWDTFIGYFGFWNQLPVMLMGVILYFLFKQDTRIMRTNYPRIISIVLFCIGILFLIGVISLSIDEKYISDTLLYGLIFSLIVVSQKISCYRVIDNPVVRTLGKYSFGIYLFHCQIVIRLYNYLFPMTEYSVPTLLLKFTIVTVTSFCISYILTNYFERPVIKMLNSRLERISLSII